MREVKHKSLEIFYKIRQSLTYSKQERSLVKLQLAKKTVLTALDNERNVKESFNLVKEAETCFENKEFDKCISLCESVIRRVQVSRTKSLDLVFVGRKLKRNYPDLPSSDLERKHLVLKAVNEIQDNREGSVFTFRQLKQVLYEAYSDVEDQFLEDLQRDAVELVQNHEDVEKVEDLGKLSLYSYQ